MARNGKKQISVWVDENLKTRYELLTNLLGVTGSQDMSSYIELAVNSHLETIEKLEELQKKIDLEKSKLQSIERQK